MNFDQFLHSYMMPNTGLEVDKPAVSFDVDSFAPNYDNARWWMFNGRGHKVFNIVNYSLKAVPENSTDNKAVSFTLVVGFGGGAGP